MQIKIEYQGAVYGATLGDDVDPARLAELVQNTILLAQGTNFVLPQVDEQELDTNE